MKIWESLGIHPDHTHQKSKYGLIKFLWMSFPEIGLARTQEIEIRRKTWMSFPEIGLCQAPEN